ncbi:hypothetical protein MUP46_01050 [Patescibacteria group bacterium]|nr:hypothetical protein [Patescibacteria group bacterium]
MGKGLLILGAVLTGLGLLMMFSGVFDAYTSIDTLMVKPLTDNTTGYIASDNSTVPNYNSFDHIIVHNLPYLLYGGAAVCIIIGLGNMRSGEQ